MERGLVHLYTGDGKGKTTAAIGLAVRAAGCGKQVGFVQFLKSAKTGEQPVAAEAGTHHGPGESAVLPIFVDIG